MRGPLQEEVYDLLLPEIEEDLNLPTWMALVPYEVGDDSPRSPHASGRH